MPDLPAAHPTPRHLADFALGKLPDEQAQAVARHLAGCPACRAAVDAQAPDAFVHELQTAAPRPSPLPSTELHHSPPPSSDLPPEFADSPRYRLLEKLGQGGMGAVYKAEQLSLHRVVAVKVLRPDIVDNPDAVRRFRQEVKAAGKLQHPNIVTAHDADQAGDSHFLVMEYVDGYSFDKLVARAGPLPVKDACQLIRQAALGLQHAHEMGMVHRDVKPHNLMLSRGGLVKILDFGLAQLPREGKTHRPTAVHAFLGTPEYVAPEQAADARDADIRADVYSLGCTLYFLLAGRPPFLSDTPLDMVLAHVHDDPLPLPQLRPEVPAELWAVVARMMAKDRAQRFATPREVAEALRPFAAPAQAPKGAGSGETPVLAPPAEEPTAPGPNPRRERAPRPKRRPTGHLLTWAVGASVVAGLLVGAAAVWKWFPRRPPEAHSGSPGEPSLPAPALVPKEVLRLTDFDWPVAHLVLYAGGTRLLTAELGVKETNHRLKVWDAVTGKQLAAINAHSRGASHVVLSPSGRYIGSVGQGAVPNSFTLRVAPAASVEQGRTYPLPKGSYHLRFTPGDKEVIAVHRRSEKATAVDVEKMTKARAFGAAKPPDRAKGPLPAVDLSPDGDHVLVADRNGLLRVWFSRTGRNAFRLAGAQPGIRAAIFSPDGTRAFTGGDDHTVRVWDWKKQRQVALLEGHGKPVGSLAVSPDGRWLLSGDTAGLLVLWDLASMKETHRLPGHTADIRGLAFSEDGRLAASGSNDKTVRLWQLRP
jgi:tRNA A-37 threonylcarbamoyl transferase component Bud32